MLRFSPEASSQSEENPIDSLNKALSNVGSELRVESFADARNLELMDEISEMIGSLVNDENHEGARALESAKDNFSSQARKAHRAARKAKLKV